MAISLLVIEDNPAATKTLTDIIAEDKNLNLVGCAENLADGEEMIYKYHPSLVFLDIELPDGNGIEFWDSIRQQVTWNIYVIFYTAYDKYAIKALRARAHDFLVKPVVREDVQKAIQQFLFSCAEKISANNTKPIHIPSAMAQPILVIDNKNKRIVLNTAEIGYFKYVNDRKVWEVYCANGKSYILRHSVNAERLLQASCDFEQVSKNYILNIKYISFIESGNITMLPPFDTVGSIVMSRLYKDTLYDKFCQL